MRHTALPEAVMGHIRDVLKSYLMKPEYSRFYVGITQASLCNKLGADARTANLPGTLFFAMTAMPASSSARRPMRAKNRPMAAHTGGRSEKKPGGRM